LDRGLGGPQSRSGNSGEGKNSQLLQGHEPLIIQLVYQLCTTELFGSVRFNIILPPTSRSLKRSSFFREKLKERDNFGGVGVDGRIILKWIS
jgi:hypothetical protein